MNFNELLGGVGKELMNAAGEALAGAAKEYLGNAINEIFVKKEADTKRTLSNIQHMKVVSSPAVLRALLMQRIMFSVWRLCGDITKQRLESLNRTKSNQGAMATAPRESSVTYGTEQAPTLGTRSRLGG